MGGVRDLVERFYEELWNRGDDLAVDQVLSEDFRFRGSLGEETVGKAGWRGYRDRVRTGSYDFHCRIRSLVVEGNAAAVRLRFSGMHTGPLLGIAPSGRTFEYAGAGFFTEEARLLASAWVLGDLTTLRRQLLGTPGDAPAG